MWNCLPGDTVDFSSLSAFKRSIKRVNLSDLFKFHLVVFCTGIMCFILQGRLLVLFFSLVALAMCVLLAGLWMYLCLLSLFVY